MSHLSIKTILIASAVTAAIALTGCSFIPTSGPSRFQVSRVSASPAASGIQVVDVTDAVARQLLSERRVEDFATKLGADGSVQRRLGVGDTIDVSIWEAPPAALFASLASANRGDVGSGAGQIQLPEQIIDVDGNINIPFAGSIMAAGCTPGELEQSIAARLKGKAHDPQVLVRLSKNVTSYVTVVGDVGRSNRLPITPQGERVLDAIAGAGGVSQPINKITIQVTRGASVASLPLETIIRDPRQNVPLRAGDVVTALYQPYSITVLGATGKNEEMNFEAQGITLAQALARAGGLEDSRSDVQGVFIFRFENENALSWTSSPVRTTPDGRVPVVYRVNLRDPNSLFVAQSFLMDDKDLLYVSNAPIAEIQKFLNVVFSVAYPVVYGVQTFK